MSKIRDLSHLVANLTTVEYCVTGLMARLEERPNGGVNLALGQLRVQDKNKAIL